MLYTLQYSSLSQKKQHLKDLPAKALYVVSDIKSHSRVQKLLQGRDTEVIRSMTLWKDLVQNTNPKLKILPGSVINTLYMEWADHKVSLPNFAKNPRAGSFISRYIKNFSHIMFHPESRSLTGALINKQKNHPIFKVWLPIAVEFTRFLDKKNVIEDSWTEGMLLDKIDPSYIPWKHLTFDLGFDITHFETELIVQISKLTSVSVFTPMTPDKKNMYPFYDSLFSAPLQQKNMPVLNTLPNHNTLDRLEVKKFSTCLAEVKDACSQITKALKEHKLKLNQIAIIAPDIEEYWPALQSFLKRENMDSFKEETALLSSFPVVQLWLAKLKNNIGHMRSETLEMIQNEKPNPFTENINSKFSNVVTLKTFFKKLNLKSGEKETDWLAQQMKHYFQIKHLKPERTAISVARFSSWAKALLPKAGPCPTDVTKAVQNSLNHILQSLSHSVTYPIHQLTELLEHTLKHREITIKKGNPDGVHILSFNALSWLEAKMVYVMGLSKRGSSDNESVLSRFSSSKEAHFLKSLSFIFPTSSPLEKEELRLEHLLSSTEIKYLFLSYPQSNFCGTPEPPSPFWIRQALKSKKNLSFSDLPEQTTWDRLQKKPFLSSADKKTSDPLKEAIDRENQSTNRDPFGISNFKMSYSKLNDYIRCPFIFAAKHVFHLQDPLPENGFDLPAARQGSFLHELFAHLVKNFDSLADDLSVQKSKIKTLFHKIKNEKPELKKLIARIPPLVWQKTEKYFMEKALQFIQFETHYRSVFKHVKPEKQEYPFSGYWNFETGCLSHKGDIPFRGTIDRIDTVGEFGIIIDYKRKMPTGSVAPSWVKSRNFQLALYIQALEQGLVESVKVLPDNVAAFFLSYKDFTFLGIAPDTEDWVSFFGGTRPKSLVKHEKRKHIMGATGSKINTTLRKITKGEFSPAPLKKELCTQCRWRTMCRAKHLT